MSEQNRVEGNRMEKARKVSGCVSSEGEDDCYARNGGANAPFLLGVRSRSLRWVPLYVLVGNLNLVDINAPAMTVTPGAQLKDFVRKQHYINLWKRMWNTRSFPTQLGR